MHCGSGPLPGPHTGPGPFGEVLARHPRLTAVIAHAGAPEYAEHFALARRYENVHLDTTMVGTPFMNALIADRRATSSAQLGDLQDKVVLGTDFPNIPYAYATSSPRCRSSISDRTGCATSAGTTGSGCSG